MAHRAKNSRHSQKRLRYMHPQSLARSVISVNKHMPAIFGGSLPQNIPSYSYRKHTGNLHECNSKRASYSLPPHRAVLGSLSRTLDDKANQHEPNRHPRSAHAQMHQHPLEPTPFHSLPSKHFCKDAANAPHVHWGGIG